MAKKDGFTRSTHVKYEQKRRDRGAGSNPIRGERSGGRREGGTSYSKGDALTKGTGTTFAGRSPFGQGKAPEVNLNMDSGNRRTSIAGHSNGKSGKTVFTGHGPITRS